VGSDNGKGGMTLCCCGKQRYIYVIRKIVGVANNGKACFYGILQIYL